MAAFLFSLITKASSITSRVLALAAGSHLRACALLLAVSLGCFLPGFLSLQPMDRDEPRFAQASKQMLETGDAVDVHFQDETRYKKPIGIYWLQSASVATAQALGVSDARTHIAFYRIPSLVGALAAVLLTYWAGLAMLDRQGALLAALFMAASILLGVEARLAKTDAVLCACCVAVLGAFLHTLVLQPRPARSLKTAQAALWGGLAVGILIKGPIVLMVAGLAAAALCGRNRSFLWMRPLWSRKGLAFLALLVLPWFLAIAWKSGGAFFTESVGKDMLGKVAGGQERHGGPPGFYLLAFFGTFWPAAPLAALAAPVAWAHRRDERVFFCLAWIIPSWIVFELVPTKLPHYVLPLYPAVALLTAFALRSGALVPAQTHWHAIRRFGVAAAIAVLPAIPLLLCVGLAVAAWLLDGVVPWLGVLALLLSLALALAGWVTFRRGDAQAAAGLSVVASLVTSIAVFGFTQPVLGALHLSPRLAAAAHLAPCDAPLLATAGYREPSLVFLTRTDLVLTDGAGAARFLQEGGCRVAFVETHEEAAFRDATGAGAMPALLTRVAGFNINSGKRLDVGVYASRP